MSKRRTFIKIFVILGAILLVAGVAVFVGGIVAGSYTAQGLPSEALVLAADDGSVYVAVTKGGVQIKGDVHVEGKITASKDIVAEERVSGAHHTHPGDSGGMTGQPV